MFVFWWAADLETIDIYLKKGNTGQIRTVQKIYTDGWISWERIYRIVRKVLIWDFMCICIWNCVLEFSNLMCIFLNIIVYEMSQKKFTNQ